MVEALVDALIKMGIPRNHARVLIELQHNGKATSKELQERLDISSGSVSSSTAYWREMGVLRWHVASSGAPGRPTLTYELVETEDLLHFIDQLARKQNSILEQAREMLNRRLHPQLGQG